MQPARSKRGTPRRSPDEIRLAIERFLTASIRPAVIEPGESPFDIVENQFALEVHAGKLLLTLWDETRSLTRRIAGITSAAHRARLELAVEKFGGVPGTLMLADLAAERNNSLPKRGERMIHREQLRKWLTRQFTGWRIAALTSDPDLEHSLSPSCPRAWLRKGTQGIAAIAAVDPANASGALTFGLIWLDYLRRREPKVTTHTLAVFLPEGTETDSALRLRHLDASKLACELYAVAPTGYERRVDPVDYCNLDTHVGPRIPPRDLDANSEQDCVESAIRALDGVESIELHDRSLSFRVRGLEFARRSAHEFLFGIETRRAVTTSHVAEVRELVRLMGEMRSSACLGNPLYQRQPERWLESQVRSGLCALDSNLCPEPVYGQVPAMAGVRRQAEGNTYRADRDVIDLLAISRTGRLRVIELKASEDIHLPMQGLDYWIRVKWHVERGDFSGHFPGMTVSRKAPKLLLVSPALDLHPANETVIRYFAREVETEQIGVGVEWRKELRVMFRRAGS